ncbi:hypothetical protein Tco_1276446 [Tanacetum coccineum]
MVAISLVFNKYNYIDATGADPIAYTDSDYAGATQDRKSTTGGCSSDTKPTARLCPKKTAWEQFSSNIATALICLATNRKYNFSRLIFEHMVTNIGSPHKFLMYPSNMRRLTKGYTGVEIRLFPTMLTSPTPSSSPSRITSSPSLSSEPSTEPTFEPQPSPDADAAFTKLILRIKKLESKVKTRKAKKRARVMLSKDEEDDSSKQGRKISDIDEDLNTYFAQEDEVVHDQDTTKGG